MIDHFVEMKKRAYRSNIEAFSDNGEPAKPRQPQVQVGIRETDKGVFPEYGPSRPLNDDALYNQDHFKYFK